MFGIGLPEMILIMALALIVVGPDKLPELARSLAKTVLELKKSVAAVKENLAEDNPFDSVKPELEAAAKSLQKELEAPAAKDWHSFISHDGVNPSAPEQPAGQIIDTELAAPAEPPEPAGQPAGKTISQANPAVPPAEPCQPEPEEPPAPEDNSADSNQSRTS